MKESSFYEQIREESTFYQHILAEGRAQGIVQDRIQDRQDVLLEQGRRKFGPPSQEIPQTIRAILDLPRLEILTDRVLDMSSWDELLAP